MGLAGDPYCLLLTACLSLTYAFVGGGLGLFWILAHFSICLSAAFELNVRVQCGHWLISPSAACCGIWSASALILIAISGSLSAFGSCSNCLIYFPNLTAFINFSLSVFHLGAFFPSPCRPPSLGALGLAPASYYIPVRGDILEALFPRPECLSSPSSSSWLSLPVTIS